MWGASTGSALREKDVSCGEFARTTRDGGETWDATQWEYAVPGGQATAKVYADGSRVAYTRTQEGWPVRTTWARGAWKEYAYDGHGNVTGASYSSTPSVSCTYDALDCLVSAENSASGADHFAYACAYDGHRNCTENDLSGTEQGAGGVGGLLATRIDGVIYIPVYGANGNIMMYVSESGSITAQYDYDPYGNILQATGPLASQFALGFSTKYHDREVGLVAYQLRTYDPVYGRWLNRDPIEESGGENLYAFCMNLPVVLFDNFGLAPNSVRQCCKNGVKISLVFDGKKLAANGFSVTAVSGRPQKKNTPSELIKDCFGRIIGTRSTYSLEFDYSKERQKIRNVGPTPEGLYYILVNEKRTKFNSVRTHVLLHSGWGDYGWSLHPEPSTQTYGRSGFFIHGGSEWGSVGCIDLKDGDSKLANYLDGMCDCYIPVEVKYVVDKNLIYETYTNWIPE